METTLVNRRSILLGAGAALTLPLAVRAQTAQITGAGATFPNPIYQKWAEAARAAIGIQVNYQSVGSGAGINQIRNRTVDFGASDAPLNQQQLTEGNLLQFPTVMGSLVAIVNIPGIENDQLRLTGPILADIYLGKITRWNDQRITAINPGLNLPNLAIAPAYRADGSGTTFVWVSYLADVSEEWKTRVGVGTSVRFPAGTGARGNEGVAGTVRQVRGAIGYVENAYAITNRLVTTQIQNKDGNFVKPEHESFMAAASAADWSVPGFAANVINTAGPKSWPIVAPTFILLPTNPTDATRSANVRRFFDWAFANGDALAQELEYIPLPQATKDAVRAAWSRQFGA
ncbi:phosphate ABC transporter substrate-binding protein PstS [Roseomonas alkaliterrae]|uniref:Phosphate-binding protein PstS n=1 Tax=Neoroseomonas alkaliterrae TaxID=1452450 RepID=A0A840XKL6_9PROT|nr:phosphate ABC transporter substrate-binding protein PstS [Neoroseomonas alkaliterrae]MBB5689145.1 phosphate transport system substrate-binding protein [Neoroseomonas alkaliterrae]MBR0675384.1 phosphate ABC transporter substrate-binding protein PstS [Neoroseomonas alkaliterrae]